MLVRQSNDAGQKLMSVRYRVAIIISVVALALLPLHGYSEQASSSLKSAQKSKSSRSAKKVSSNPGPTHIYRVRPGDTLLRIAAAHKTTVASIKSTNKLQGDLIQAGQKLHVPGSPIVAAKQASAKSKKELPAPSGSYITPSMSALADSDQSSDQGNEPLRLRLVKAGFDMLGVRYRRSGGSEESGFDCSGLVKNLFSKFNIELPRSSREQFMQGEKVARSNLEIGDLVFFSSGGKRPTHVGIYVGDNKFLHSAIKARQVIISDLDKIWYAMRYIGARRIADLWGDAQSSESQNN
jgi:peptidoglycan DL-endopeptidase LytE